MRKNLTIKRMAHPLFKYYLKIKLCTFFVVMTCSFLHADDIYSERTKITLNSSDISVGDPLYKTANNLSAHKFFYEMPIQQIVSGTVTDESGQPLPGANILEKGTINGVSADFDGNFSINLTDKNAILEFSYVGFATKEFIWKGQTTIKIQLKESAASLDEVVIVGYGSMKKRDLTGSVTSVKGEELSRSANASLDQALQGKASGVHITQNNGTPGGGVSVRIRGIGGINNSEPLYIVDGIQYAPSQGQSENSSPLSTISPNDVESIEVLKDAATTSIYGSRAANGVILITTKHGKKGIGEISYSNYYGLQQMAKSVEVMNGEQYATFMNTSSNNAGLNEPFTDPASFGLGTNWVDEVTRVARIQNHSLSFSKGNENGSFFLSVGYFNQEGTVIGSHFDRMSMRFNGESQISESLKVGSNMSFSKSNQQRDSGELFYIGTVLARAYMFYPTIPAYDSDGNFAGPTGNSFYKNNQVNPVYWANNIYAKPSIYDLAGNVFGELSFLDHFSMKSSISFRLVNTKKYSQDPIYEIGDTSDTDNLVTKKMGQLYDWTFENVINYNNTFGKDHSLNMLLGHSLQSSINEFVDTGVAYPFNGLTTTSLNGSQLTLVNDIQEYSLASVFGRVFYSFKDKYLLTGNMRYDGSSRFGSNRRWGLFPSFSGAWRVSDEDFFNMDNLSLKIRAGWGQVGANDIGNYSKYALIGSGQDYPMSNNDGTTLPGSALQGIANPDLRWETSTQSNIGFDLIGNGGRLNVSADYYVSKRSDMLIGVPLSALAGISFGTNAASLIQNAAALKNSGLEFSIGYSDDFNKFGYDVNANFTTYKNVVTNLGSKGELFSYPYNSNFFTRTQVGGELGEFYGYVFDGVFQTPEEISDNPTQVGAAPGDFKFKDVSGPEGKPDNLIDENDQVNIGSPIPDFTFGLSTKISYGAFDLSLQFNGEIGKDIFNLTKLGMMDLSRSENKVAELVNYWDGPGSTNEYPRPNFGDSNRNTRPSSYFVENGSFLRCQLMQIGLNVPLESCKLLGISKLRIYTSVQNLFTITNYSGVDPAIGNLNGSNLGAGIDQFSYPISRTYLMGLNINF